jgi:hypothetical protein
VLSRRTLLIMDYILVSYLIKVLKRFSVACHYKVYIVDLLCSKADVGVYVPYGKVCVCVAFVAYNLRAHYWFSSHVC